MKALLVLCGVFVVSLTSSACATNAARLTRVTVCGSSLAIPDVLPPSDSRPVVLMAAPCLIQSDGKPVIPDAYRPFVKLQASTPMRGVWVPYDEDTKQEMQADYRRLWDTGRLGDLTIEVVDHVFPNGVTGKIVTYTLKER